MDTAVPGEDNNIHLRTHTHCGQNKCVLHIDFVDISCGWLVRCVLRMNIVWVSFVCLGRWVSCLVLVGNVFVCVAKSGRLRGGGVQSVGQLAIGSQWTTQSVKGLYMQNRLGNALRGWHYRFQCVCVGCKQHLTQWQYRCQWHIFDIINTQFGYAIRRLSRKTKT